MDGVCDTYGEKRNVYRLLLRKPEGKRLLGRPRHRWDDNITDIVWKSVDRIHSSFPRL